MRVLWIFTVRAPAVRTYFEKVLFSTSFLLMFLYRSTEIDGIALAMRSLYRFSPGRWQTLVVLLDQHDICPLFSFLRTSRQQHCSGLANLHAGNGGPGIIYEDVIVFSLRSGDDLT